MGVLIERLARTAERGGAAMGFGAAARPERTLALLVETHAGGAAALLAAGADGLVLDDDGDRPAGAALGRRGAGEGDFIILAAGDPAAAWSTEQDRVIEIDPGADEELVRALLSLEAEAVLVRLGSREPTIGELAGLRRALAGPRPSLVELDFEPDAGVLRLLRDNGAAGILVRADAGVTARLVSAIEGLPARPKPRRASAEGVLGRNRG